MVGILAFGSLIDDIGAELEPVVQDDRLVAQTPFQVEFARISAKTRGGSPTLVPVEGFGARVAAAVLVLHPDVSATSATDMLYRRETRQIGTDKPYKQLSKPFPDQVLVRRLDDFIGVKTVLYTDFPKEGKLSAPTAELLAHHAVASARAREDGFDGISYLVAAKRNRIWTPLMPSYEQEILRLTGVGNLEAALVAARTAKP